MPAKTGFGYEKPRKGYFYTGNSENLCTLVKHTDMKVTLITGASSGIGEAFARRLAAEKHNLVLVARSEAKLQALCTELEKSHGVQARYIALDLLQPDAAERLFAETERQGLEVDTLINNAGFGSAGDFAKLPLQGELDMISLNVRSLVALTHLYLQPMRKRGGGTLINVASAAAFQPIPYMAAYAATKAFVRSFTEALAEENRPYHIRIMLLCPGATETGFFDAADIRGSQKNNLVGTNLQTPEQVVEAALQGLRRGKRVTVSGFGNKMMVGMSAIMPNRLIVRALSGRFRNSFG